jgi:nitrate/nitrite-specific signal transduction histidine kinase
MDDTEIEKQRTKAANSLPIEIRGEWLSLSKKLESIPIEASIDNPGKYEEEVKSVVDQMDALVKQANIKPEPKSSTSAVIVILAAAVIFIIWVISNNV